MTVQQFQFPLLPKPPVTRVSRKQGGKKKESFLPYPILTEVLISSILPAWTEGRILPSSKNKD